MDVVPTYFFFVCWWPAVSGGPVPQLVDTDPEQYNPMHQLDELADGDSCKKQRVQPSLLQQVVSRVHVAHN